MGQPDISFIIPTRDGEIRLNRAIDDVAGSSAANGEIIIVDDGSDEPPADCLRHQSKIPVRLLVNETNIGPGASRNKAIMASDAAYVCFVDDDDAVEPDALQAFDPADLNDADIVLMKFLDENNDVMSNDGLIDDLTGNRPGLELMDAYRQRLRVCDIVPLQCQAYLFRRAFLLESDVRFPLTWLAEDQVFLTKAMLSAATAAIWPKPYYRYRTRPNSLKTSGGWERCLDFCRALNDLRVFLGDGDITDQGRRAIARQSIERLVRLFCIRLVALNDPDRSRLVEALRDDARAGPRTQAWAGMPDDVARIVRDIDEPAVNATVLSTHASRLLFSRIPTASPKYFIYCCGPMGRAVRAHLVDKGVAVNGFLDDNADLEGSEFEGHPVFDLDEVWRDGALNDASVIVANPQPNIAETIREKLSGFRDRHALKFDIVLP